MEEKSLISLIHHLSTKWFMYIMINLLHFGYHRGSLIFVGFTEVQIEHFHQMFQN